MLLYRSRDGERRGKTRRSLCRTFEEILRLIQHSLKGLKFQYLEDERVWKGSLFFWNYLLLLEKGVVTLLSLPSFDNCKTIKNCHLFGLSLFTLKLYHLIIEISTIINDFRTYFYSFYLSFNISSTSFRKSSSSLYTS